jgi:hypothetical protein
MYHNWYEMYVTAKQIQRDLYRQADEARRAEVAPKAPKPRPAPDTRVSRQGGMLPSE